MDVSSLLLREAADADRESVLAWANDPETRAASFDSAPISKAAHRAWFAESLAGARHLYIIERDGSPIGLARLDPISADEAVVSLTIAPEQRGRGVGSAALGALSDKAESLGLSRLRAKIKKSNTRSQRAFERSGFNVRGEEVVRGSATLLYELETGKREASSRVRRSAKTS